jgi:iron complex transport system substrate-binding protein
MRSKLALTCLCLPGLAAAQLPSVASINLCTDQLVLTVADPAQIVSLSWLSADPEESMLATQAASYPLNYGSAEELVAIGADVVIAGTETSPYTRELLRRLGSTVVEIEPEDSLDEVVRNLRVVGAATGRTRQTESVIAQMQNRIESIRQTRGNETASAVVVRPGGFTIGRNTLANELLELAGLDNVVAELDRWGSLSIETLLASDPDVIVLTTYRSDEPSLANSFFSHPALRSIGDTVRIEVPARYFSCGAPESLVAAETLVRQLERH